MQGSSNAVVQYEITRMYLAMAVLRLGGHVAFDMRDFDAVNGLALDADVVPGIGATFTLHTPDGQPVQARRPPPRPEGRRCAECRALFLVTATNQKQRYCGRRCQMRASNRRWYATREHRERRNARRRKEE
jgi:hypothetical protein